MFVHGLSRGIPVVGFHGIEDAMMTLQRSALSFLRLEVLIPRFAQQIHQGKRQALQDPVLGHAGQKMMKRRILMGFMAAAGHFALPVP